MNPDQELIKRCLKSDKKALQSLYDTYSPQMWGVCLRYAKNEMFAKDLMQEGFIKVYQNLKSYTGRGSLGGWIRRIMVNTALNYLKKHIKGFNEVEYEYHESSNGIGADAFSQLNEQDLIKLIQSLPNGARTVFNLYAIEGYKHQEIAEQLNISESTSKTQLLRARVLLKEKIKSNSYEYAQKGTGTYR